MIEVNDSELTEDHRDFLQEWANNLGVSIDVLLGRIVLATSEGLLYTEKILTIAPDRPDMGHGRYRLVWGLIGSAFLRGSLFFACFFAR